MFKELECIPGSLIDRIMVWLGARKNVRDKLLGALLFGVVGLLGFSLWLLGASEFLKHITPHAFAVSLELFLGLIFIEILWRNLEKKEETKQRQTQLRHIKNYMFQASMRSLFRANFQGLQSPRINFTQIKEVGMYGDLRALKKEITKEGVLDPQKLSYKKGAEAEIFLEYVKAEEQVWKHFLQLAIMFNFPEIVRDMTEIGGCIAQAKVVIGSNPLTKSALESFLLKEQKTPQEEKLQMHIEKIIKAGILKFIEFAEDVRECDKVNRTEMFEPLMNSFEAAA
jgi:hypothetical protein